MIDSFVGQEVVIDTDARISYLGRLVAVQNDFVHLENVTIYDGSEARVPAEQYLVECVKFGRATSRQKLWVPCPRIVAVSRLSDVTIPA